MSVNVRFAALLILFFLLLAATAKASTPAPELNAVVSKIAGTDLTVRCFLNDGEDPDSVPDAWGYVSLFDTVVFLAPKPCAGALALERGSMAPLWEQALGALVLTHEAYHLKLALPYWRRAHEAQTECRAVKRVPQTILEMSHNAALTEAILPWALAIHYKESLFDAYNYPSCKVPVFSEFWP